MAHTIIRDRPPAKWPDNIVDYRNALVEANPEEFRSLSTVGFAWLVAHRARVKPMTSVEIDELLGQICDIQAQQSGGRASREWSPPDILDIMPEGQPEDPRHGWYNPGNE
jgi:hypothetical protein